MGTELLVGLLLVSSLNLQQAIEPFPVAHAQETFPQIPPKETILKLEDLPWEMQKVAYCESGGRQFDDFGKVIKNRLGTPDYGIFQINAIHFPEVKRLGLDVMKEEDNIEFAMILYKRNGLRDWTASRQCLAQYGIKV